MKKMNSFRLAVIIFGVITLASFKLPYANLQVNGKQLFMANCASCHHPTRNLTGPHFYNVRARWKDYKLLYAFIRNSQQVIKKDAYAKQLFEQWNKTVMTNFGNLTDVEIKAILDYVDDEAKKKGLIKE
jgi:mono/diheme cytochrome c family protein